MSDTSPRSDPAASSACSQLDTTIRLPEPEGWLANAILNCLRAWQQRSGPGPWIVARADIEQLARWAADLQREYQELGTRFRLITYPVPVH